MIYVRGHKLVTVYTREWGSFKYIMCDASSNKTSSRNVYTELIRRKSAHTLNCLVEKKKKRKKDPNALTEFCFIFTHTPAHFQTKCVHLEKSLERNTPEGE